MLLVIPVSLSDHKLIPGTLERAFEVFSPGSGHKLLVTGSPNVSSSVSEVAQKLCKHFAGNASTYIFDLDCELGWPGACNYYFQQAAWHIGSDYGEPWLWYEADTTPTRAGWLDEIENETIGFRADAIREGRPVPRYFGASEPACLEFQGTLMPDAGRQMAAVGVYPADMSDVLSLRAVSATNIIWNTFLRWYVMPSFAEVPLFQNNWRTAKYARVPPDDAIGCVSVANWAWDVHFNKPINPKAALVHGCKDGTLLELIQRHADPAVAGEGYSCAGKEKFRESEYWTDYKDPTQEQKIEKVLTARRKLVEMKNK